MFGAPSMGATSRVPVPPKGGKGEQPANCDCLRATERGAEAGRAARAMVPRADRCTLARALYRHLMETEPPVLVTEQTPNESQLALLHVRLSIVKPQAPLAMAVWQPPVHSAITHPFGIPSPSRDSTPSQL